MDYTFTISEETKQIIEVETGKKIEEFLEDVRNSIESNNADNKLSIEKAAQLMGVGKQMLREGLKRNSFPFGCAVLMPSKKFRYYISPKKFTEYTGIKID